MHRMAVQDGGLPVEALCMGCKDEACDFKPMPMLRRPVGDEDVLMEMFYCGICHTDLHTAAGHLGGLGMKKYPCVPGHELAGVCTAVGKNVTRVKVGDHVGVGCMVDSCLNCSACKRGEEQKCSKQVGTYGANNKNGRAATGPVGGATLTPAHTLGGYTTQMVVHERFAIIIPKEYGLEYAGPVMCAGVTLFDPLRRYKATAGSRVAVVGLGGLGQMGVKIAEAMGCTVTVVSRSPSKEKFAKQCGATAFICSTDAAQVWIDESCLYVEDRDSHDVSFWKLMLVNEDACQPHTHARTHTHTIHTRTRKLQATCTCEPQEHLLDKKLINLLLFIHLIYNIIALSSPPSPLPLNEKN